jgi:hypothetical protein
MRNLYVYLKIVRELIIPSIELSIVVRDVIITSISTLLYPFTSVMSIDESTSLTIIRNVYSYLRIIYVILPIPRYVYTYLVNVREVLSPEVIVKVKRWRRVDIGEMITSLFIHQLHCMLGIITSLTISSGTYRYLVGVSI